MISIDFPYFPSNFHGEHPFPRLDGYLAADEDGQDGWAMLRPDVDFGEIEG